MLPDWESLGNTFYDIGEAEIGYILNKTATGLLLTVMLPRLTGKLAGYGALRTAVDDLKHDCQIVLAGSSVRELDYQAEVLEEIVRSNGGILLDLGDLPLAGLFWWGFIRNYIPPILFRPGGHFLYPLRSGRVLRFADCRGPAGRGDEEQVDLRGTGR